MGASGQVMLLTGCASGIGKHLMGRYLAAGYRVVATDIQSDAIANEAPDKLLVPPLDVRDADAWEAVIAETLRAWGRLDVLINVAGYLRPGFLTDTDREDISRHMRVNVEGLMLGTRAAARHMRKQGHGHIINFGSLASLTPVPGLSLYSASKHAVRGFTLAVGQELRREGIAVSLLLPDAVETPMLDAQVGHDAAALTFSGAKALTVEDVGEAVDRILRDRPIEISIPTSRGLIAKAAGLSPRLAQALEPVFRRMGRRKQDGRRTRRSPPR